MTNRNDDRESKKNNVLLTYYGDDLTGSTDSMEALELGGVSTILFLEPPTPELVACHPQALAIGLAGTSRTMTPAEMDSTLPKAFDALKQLGAPLTHYKICSTFDSSPDIGSIGRATEIGIRVFETPIVPVLVGAPKLKRYVVFGNHFATTGGVTYRLDRHPTMSKHPITPMGEADLCLHLGAQTSLPIGLLNIHHLTGTVENIQEYFHQMAADDIRIVMLDTLDNDHLLKLGELLWKLGQTRSTFVVGSSGIEFALTNYWQSSGQVITSKTFPSQKPVDRIVAISGSAAPMTANQIQHALDHGFVGIRLDSVGLIDPQTANDVRENAISQALSILQKGQSVILLSALGSYDEQITKTKAAARALGFNPQGIGELLGKQQGSIIKEILLKTTVRRLAIAGGDTSGYVLRQLGAYLLEFIAPLGVATPLCRIQSHIPMFSGLEVVMKGGQLGEIDFFAHVLNGEI